MIHDNIPYTLLPNLEEYGIEEIERGVCEDTYENRKLLRHNRLNLQVQYDPETGQPTGNIMVISNKMSKEAAEIRIQRRIDLLTDPGDTNSDYYTGADLLIVPEVENIVPAAVLNQTKRIRDAEMRDIKAARDGLAPKKLSYAQGGAYPYPQRCTAYRGDMLRCLMWTNGVDKPDMCRIHLKKEERRPSVAEQVQTARTRILEMSVQATDAMAEILEDPDAPVAVRLKAATELLDRAGVRGGYEIEQKVEITDQTATILARLDALAPKTAAIEAGEVIEDAVESAEESPEAPVQESPETEA